MALLVPDIGELESLRYLINQSNHIADREDNAPRDLVLKLFTSDTTPAEGDVPSATAYFEPYAAGNTNTYGTAPSTGYPACVNNRTEARYDYTDQYGILLNGSRWEITQVGGTTTATYPEQTFTFTSAAGNVYGYYIVRATNMPVAIQGVTGVSTASAGTTVTKSNVVGVIGNDYITLDNVANVMDNVTLGMRVSSNAGNSGPNGIDAGSIIVGVDRATRRVYLDKALIDNIQVSNNNASIDFNFSVVTTTSAHGLQPGDIIYIAQGAGNSTTEANTYTVYETPTGSTFTTTPALKGTGGANVTLYSSIMYAERFTNGPYEIQNNGDQIKITLNISLD
jgi:hypothetical protein